jgi:hypothetical protein
VGAERASPWDPKFQITYLCEQMRRKKTISSIWQPCGSHLLKMGINGIVHSSLNYFFHGSTGSEATFFLPGVNRSNEE